MAYTKTPEQDTHSLFRIPPRGNQTFTSVTGPYTNRAGLRYVNCYPIIRESKTTDPKITLVKAPKLESVVWEFPDSDPGMICYDYQTNLFVYKSKIYRATAPGPTITLEYTATGYKFLSCQKIVDYAGNGEIIITGLVIDQATQFVHSYTYNYSTDTFEVGDNALAGPGTIDSFALVRDLVIDGYHIVATKARDGGTNRVYLSVVGDPNTFYTSTDFFVPEIDPDNIVDIQKHKNFICILGTNTIEFFYNAGNELGSAFQRQENYTIRLGASQNIDYNQGVVSVALGDDIYFIASSENGGNSVYVIRNFQAIKVSDDYVDFLLSDQEGVVKDTSPSTIELGFADIMGNIQLVVQVRDQTTSELTTVLLFNERDMVWWEWSDSDDTGFISSTIGMSNSLSGKPLFLDGPTLGVDSNAQFSVIVPTRPTSYYEYDPIRIVYMNALLQKTYTATVSMNGHLT